MQVTIQARAPPCMAGKYDTYQLVDIAEGQPRGQRRKPYYNRKPYKLVYDIESHIRQCTIYSFTVRYLTSTSVVTVRSCLPVTEETYYHTRKSETNIPVFLWPGITSKFGLSQHKRTVHDDIVLVCDVKGCLLTGLAK